MADDAALDTATTCSETGEVPRRLEMVRAKSNGEEIGLTGWSEAMQLDSSSRSTVAIAGRGSEKAETERSCSDVATGPGTGAREDELRFSTSFEVRKD